MRKNTLLLLIILYPVAGFCQPKIDQNCRVVVRWEVKKQLAITVRDVEMATQEQIGDVVITNHLGVVKGTAKALMGVKVKELLADIELTNYYSFRL